MELSITVRCALLCLSTAKHILLYSKQKFFWTGFARRDKQRWNLELWHMAFNSAVCGMLELIGTTPGNR